MPRNIICLFALMGVLLVYGAPSQAGSSSSEELKEANILVEFLGKDMGRDPSNKLKPATRTERRAHLSEDDREMMTKQIVKALSEVMNSDCMSGRDYHGWVDFGRREAE